MLERAVVTVDLPPGPCVLIATPHGLAEVRLLARETATPGARSTQAVLDEAERQLRAYFAGELQAFDLPLDLTGRTAFQTRVLAACRAIQYGATISYGELARRSGHSGAARAVGQVMATNRLALVVPCHRVVAGAGGLGGYGGGVDFKRRLLALERRQVGWEQVD
ncbi:MAG: methylated-DNA--[protein]-cysteine S-methyltransferase [Armatimonadetes bacterium]|nr:methylated-DNA--[protein]-cysteine S-methyltransferase [Armatimonadota bacterium]